MMGPLTFPQPLGGVLKLDSAALATMLSHLQLDPRSPEAGGVLIGRLIADSQDVVVDSATPPQPCDARSRFRIDRVDPVHQHLVDAAFAASGGTYLGEWHTHPEDDPKPSSLDLRTWRRKAREDLYYGDGLLFIIMGRTTLRVWHGQRGGQTITLVGAAPLDQGQVEVTS